MFAASKTSAAVAGAPPPATDPQFNNVTLLLHGDGTNGAQNNTFVDSSTNNFTITRNGTPTQGSFSPYGDLWSIFSTSSSDFLSGTGNVQFTGNFTIEAWVFITSAAGRDVFKIGSEASGRVSFGVDSSNRLFSSAFGTSSILYGGASVSLNTWTHVAWVRNGTTVTGYVNGVAQGTQTISGNVGNTSGFLVGQGPMYASNARFVNGTALYTANFTPSTTPLTAVSGTSLLTCQSNRFRDNSSNNFAITVNGTPSVQRFSPFDPAAEYSTSVIGGSGFFGGSGNYISIAGTVNQNLIGNVNFTIEAWVYSTTSSFNQTILSHTDLGSGRGFGWNLRYESGYNIKFYVGSGTAGNDIEFLTATSTGVKINEWNHIAVVRNGATVFVYVNGVQRGSAAMPATFNVTGTVPFQVGQRGTSLPEPIVGYVTNARTVSGTAVYTAAFTPPTAPLTAITNTSLLLNTVNAGIFDNAMMNDLVTVGNAQVSTAVKKYGTGSMYFDGTGDNLSAPGSDLHNLPGEFTVECWFYTTSTAAQRIAGKWNGTSNVAWILVVNPGGSQIQWATGNNGTFQATFSYTATVSTSTWHHIAVTRSGTTIRAFLNGVQVGSSSTSSANLTAPNTNALTIGQAESTGYVTGYIDDLRITRVARYTANFTPPTAAFPNN